MENYDAVRRDDDLRQASRGLEFYLGRAYRQNAEVFKGATNFDLHGEGSFNPEALVDGAGSLEGEARVRGLSGPGGASLDEEFERFQVANQRLEDYRAAHPEDLTVLTFPEMWEDLKKRNKEYARIAKDVQDRAGFMGTVGGFTAGMAASLDPTTNPLNAWSMFIGAGGAGIFAKIMREAGLGSTIETLNQFTGVARRQELLGTPTTAGQKVGQIALAGVTAGAFRGAIEGAPAAARAIEGVVAPEKAIGRDMLKTLRDEPVGDPYMDTAAEFSNARLRREEYEDALIKTDVDNIPNAESRAAVISERNAVLFARANPYSDTEIGLELHWERFAEVATPITRSLADELRGTTADTSFRPRFEEPDFEATTTSRQGAAEGNIDPRVIDAAKEQNPVLVERFLRLKQIKEQKVEWLDDLRGAGKERMFEAETANMDTRIASLEKEMEGLTGKRAGVNKAAIRELEDHKKTIRDRLDEGDTPDMARVRQEVLDADIELRDMSEKVSAIFRHARQQVGVDKPVTRKNISQSGRQTLEGIIDKQEIDEANPVMSVINAMDRNKINGMSFEESAAKITRALDESDPQVKETHEVEYDTLLRTVDDETNTMDFGGSVGKVDMDSTRIQMTDVEEGGTLSLREYLAEGDADIELHSAVVSCRTGGVT